ncbi:MAG: DUF2505 family protein [Deltaproteobacteria bacterium]|nr:DUF2505 family protein [Deltaproteobacteria bacterium]
MKYRIESEFPCDRDTLIRVMYSEGIAEKLLPSMKSVREVQTLSRDEKDGRVRRRVRYLPVPMISSVGPKKVEPQWMEWVEESDVDLKAGRATYRNVPTTAGVAKLLKNGGEVEFVALGPGRTRRILSGELKVDVFVLGAIAERVIYGHAKDLVDEEAAALRRYIEGGGR